MAILNFPPLESADEQGYLAIGGDLEITSLLLAYSRGIFPWPISEEYPLAWFSPDPRGILYYKNLHISKSMKKFMRTTSYKIKFNNDFKKVIISCAEVKRKDESETWINQQIIDSYFNLFKLGFAYSVEVYDGESMVGGLYGVSVGQYVSAESMFYLKDNASKFAVIKLLEHLQTKKINWVDTQMVTPIIKTMGGCEISRSLFIKKLKDCDVSLTTRPSKIFN